MPQLVNCLAKYKILNILEHFLVYKTPAPYIFIHIRSSHLFDLNYMRNVLLFHAELQ